MDEEDPIEVNIVDPQEDQVAIDIPVVPKNKHIVIHYEKSNNQKTNLLFKIFNESICESSTPVKIVCSVGSPMESTPKQPGTSQSKQCTPVAPSFTSTSLLNGAASVVQVNSKYMSIVLEY